MPCRRAIWKFKHDDDAFEVRQVVVHKGQRAQLFERGGLGTAAIGGAAGGEHAVDGEALLTQVRQTRIGKLRLQRRHADQVVTRIDQALACAHRAVDGRNA